MTIIVQLLTVLALCSVHGTQIYWTQAGEGRILRADASGSDTETLLAGLPLPTRIAVDILEEKIYWTDVIAHTIQRASLDGSDAQILFADALVRPVGIVLDQVESKMYWVDTGENPGNGRMQRADKDGSNVEDVLTGLTGPTGIALDPQERRLYWTEHNNVAGSLMSANLDDMIVETLVTAGVVYPRGIALDLQSRKIYWIDGGTARIHRASFNGSGVETLFIFGQANLVDIALDVVLQKVYWTDEFNSKIQRANLNGGEIENIVTGTQASRPFGICTNLPPFVVPVAGTWALIAQVHLLLVAGTLVFGMRRTSCFVS